MKRLICLLLILICMHPINMVKSTLYNDVQYVRTDGYNSDVKYPVSVVIKSKSDLLNYYEENKDRYNLESFLDVANQYDDSFFNEYTLILVLLEEGSGSIKHKVTKVAVTNDVLNIDIKRIVPEVGTADMAEWHLFISVPKSFSFSSIIVNV